MELPLRVVPEPYVEHVRFRWERRLEHVIAEHLDDAEPARPDPLPPGAVPLTPALASRVHDLACEVCRTLGCRHTFALYQSPALDELNAFGLIGREPFGIQLVGPLVAVLDDDALRALLGHEIGHRLAHGPDADPPSLRFRESTLNPNGALARSYAVATEITADRFALLACQDLSALVRLEVTSRTGLPATSLGLLEHQHVADVCAAVEAGRAALFDGPGHPSGELRLYAASLFHRSGAYRALTGGGLGQLEIQDVDDRVAEVFIPAELRAEIRRRVTDELCFQQDAASLPALHDGPSQFRIAAPAAEPQSPLPAGDATVTDELEVRFRELERRAAAGGVPPELERRFLELEEREAKASSRRG